MFRALEAHAVRYVLIGGLAATLHGSPLRTGDADICPAKDAENLDRLARALEAMDARIRTPDAETGVRFACDARFLAGVELLNLTTRSGDLDIAFRPAGTGGSDDLLQAAERYDLERRGGGWCRGRYAPTAWPASRWRDRRHRACSTVWCARTAPTSSPPSMPALMGVACHRSSPPSSGSFSGVGCWRTASPASAAAI